MRIARHFLIICIITATASMTFARPDAAPPLSQADGNGINWYEWLSAHGPAVVVFWASWLPENQRDLGRLRALQQAAEEIKLGFVVVAIQEPLEDSRRALDPTGIPWIHDRHGKMLKHLVVFTVPSVAVVREDGAVVARLNPEPEEIRRWND